MDHLSYLHNPPQNLLIHTYQEKQHQNQQKPLPWFFSGLNGLTPVLHFLIPSSPILALLSSPAQCTKQYLPVFHKHIFWYPSKLQSAKQNIVFVNKYQLSMIATFNIHLLINPLYPNISRHILHSILYTFPELLTRRICLKIKSFISCWSFP